MDLDKISDDRLFQNNTKEEIVGWINSLDYFNYMRARSGHNCEGDSFSAYFKYDDLEDLKEKLQNLGVTLNQIPDGFIAYDPFESYSFDDLDKLRIPIPGHADLEQPHYVNIMDYKAHIWILVDSFEITISGKKDGNAYKVSEEDFKICMELEKEFDRLKWKPFLNDDIKNYAHCISKNKYPELFE